MKIGVISDIHGNLPALEASLSQLKELGVDEIACLGDTVGVLGWNGECVEMVQSTCEHIVLGNHDRRVVPGIDFDIERRYEEIEMEMVTDQLDAEQIDWLAGLPEEARVQEANVRMVHSHPDPDIRWVGDDRVTPAKVAQVGGYTGGDCLFVGHTHEQHAADLSKFDGQEGVVLNPGSVGVPYYADAEFAVYNSEVGSWELLSTEYDEQQVVERLTGLGVYTELKGVARSRRPHNRSTLF